MGEEQEKKSESKDEETTKLEETPKAEDAKKDEKKSDGGEPEAAEQPPPPPPQEVVLKVYMHCEGCARKVRRCLKGFPGVEDVITDCKTSKVVVKGERADPIKVLERVQKKSHRQVELISPIPKPPLSEEPKKEAEPNVAEIKEEPPVITVVLSVYMHCEACAQEIKKRILRMKGVESAEPDIKASQVTVKGVIEPEKLTDYVYKRTGKHAQIVKVEPEQKKEPEEEKPKEDDKAEQAPKEPEKKPEEPVKENKESEGGNDKGAGEAQADEPGPGPETDDSKLELIRNEFYYSYPQIENHQVYYPQRFLMQADHQYYDSYPPQMFSDENPNACSVM